MHWHPSLLAFFALIASSFEKAAVKLDCDWMCGFFVLARETPDWCANDCHLGYTLGNSQSPVNSFFCKLFGLHVLLAVFSSIRLACAHKKLSCFITDVYCFTISVYPALRSLRLIMHFPPPKFPLTAATLVLGAVFSLSAAAANVAPPQASPATALGMQAAAHSNAPAWILIPVFGAVVLLLTGLVFFVKRAEKGSVPGMREQWNNDCFREQMRERALHERSQSMGR